MSKIATMSDAGRWRAAAPAHGMDSAEPGALRLILLALLLLGALGLAVELFLLEHTESWTQLVPFIVLGLGLVATLWVAVRPGRRVLRVFQAAMVAFVVAGIAGLVLHYRGNVEFELEMHPELEGLSLVWKALTGATPALAPGALAQLGLLGLAYAYRHPLLRRPPAQDPTEEARR